MDRLSIYLTLMTGAVITGTCVVAAFTLGYVGLWPIVVAAAFGLLTSWPAGYVISRRIKREDPNWHRTPADSDGLHPQSKEV